MKIGKKGSKVSHLMFADDLILFRTTFEMKIQFIMDILSQFCISHCQKVNMEKSNIMFSGNNALVSIRNLIFSKSGFMESSYLDTYLGVPLTGKILRIKDYSYLNKNV